MYDTMEDGSIKINLEFAEPLTKRDVKYIGKIVGTILDAEGYKNAIFTRL